MSPFRDRLSRSITYKWFVQSKEDVADFVVEIRPSQADGTQPDLLSKATREKVVGYGLRSDTINDVDNPIDYFVCIRARNSLGFLRPWKANQCQKVGVNNQRQHYSSSSNNNPTIFYLVLLSFLYVGAN